MPTLTQRIVTLAICLTGLLAATAMAQSRVVLNSEIPQMLVRICPTVEDARRDASTASSLGSEAYREGSLDALRGNERCRLVYAAVTPLREEFSISPFATWSISYDENSTEAVRAPFLGENWRIRITHRLEQVRYYFSNFKTSGGQSLSGWAEIPERPYILSYLDAQKKKPTDK